MLQIELIDTGVGITEVEQEKIFTTFFRSEEDKNRKMNPSGVGLGMYISRAICRALGGDLIVKSKLGYGSTFTMTMHIKWLSDCLDKNSNLDESDDENNFKELRALKIKID